MAKKTATAIAEPEVNRAITFRAPDQIHGQLKIIAAHLEMAKVRVDGHMVYERDVLIYLINDFFKKGSEHWIESLRNASTEKIAESK